MNKKRTHNWSQQTLAILPKRLQRILLVPRTFDELGNAAGANIAQNRLDLVSRGRVLGNVELERLASRLGLSRVVAGLVDRSASLGVGGDLLD
jgi:hypothetical protein